MGATAGVGFLLNQRLLGISTGGMEPFLFIGLTMFSLLLLTNRQPIAAGALGGLAFLCRPEGVFLIPLAVIAFWQVWPKLLRSALAFAGVTAPWLVFSQLRYGSIVPQSVQAKAVPLFPLPPGAALDSVVRWCNEATFGGRAMGVAPWGAMLLGLVLVAGALTAAIPAFRRKLAFGPAILLVGTLGLYAWSNPLIFPWYWPPLFAAAYVTIFVGFAAAARRALERRPQLDRPAIRWSLAAVGALWLLLASFHLSRTGLPSWKSAFDSERDPERRRILAYRTAAERLNKAAGPTDSVAGPEIGALGYYYHGRILDSSGLVSPQAMEFLPAPADQTVDPSVAPIRAEFVQKVNPRWVVTMPAFAALSLGRSPWFQANYGGWMKVPLEAPLWDSNEVLIFRRRN